MVRQTGCRSLGQGPTPEVRTLGCTLKRWRLEITAWYDYHFSNEPTEAMNNLITRVKRVAFGFASFRNYRIPSPIESKLYSGKPDWSLRPVRHHPRQHPRAKGLAPVP